MDSPPPAPRPLRSTLLPGFAAGVMAGLLMLTVMASLRLFAGVPTPTEMMFDRIFPLVSVDFFIAALRRAGGYTPLKLDAIYAALAGQLLVAGVGGMVYARYHRRRSEHDAGLLVLPGVVVVTALFMALLWPNLVTSYRGLPPSRAPLLSSVGMLLSFAMYGLGTMGFYGLLTGNEFPADTTPSDAVAGMGRRRFIAAGISAGLAVVLGGLLRRLYQSGTFFYDGRQYAGPQVQRITPIRPRDEFYQASKNLVDPDVVRSLWRLEVAGQVDTPRSFTFAEMAAMPSVTQETTLLSMRYSVGSGLCSNARWRGVPLPQLLDLVKPWGDDAAILFHAADGFYETIRFEKALEPTTLLAYEMNEEPLPRQHGFPLRLIAPGLYGEKSAKWLTRLEVVDRNDPRLHRPHGLGFYREQGWGPDDEVPTHSRIDAPQVDGDRFAEAFKVGEKVELRGMAFGGDRGIARVEVSLDDARTWAAAEIHDPGTKVSWSLWRYVFVPATLTEDLRVSVRATDGEGHLQIAEDRPAVPHGATGLHRVKGQVKTAEM